MNTREAAKLEKQAGKVERLESKALRDGEVSQKEASRIDHAQDKLSRNIYQEKHDAQRGNPNSASSQRMQQDVQGNINQQQRIQQGMNSGSLTQREVGRLQQREGQINRMQAVPAPMAMSAVTNKVASSRRRIVKATISTARNMTHKGAIATRNGADQTGITATPIGETATAIRTTAITTASSATPIKTGAGQQPGQPLRPKPGQPAKHGTSLIIKGRQLSPCA